MSSVANGYNDHETNSCDWDYRFWYADTSSPFTFLNMPIVPWPTLPTTSTITISDIYYYHLPKIIFKVICGENVVTSSSLAAGET